MLKETIFFRKYAVDFLKICFLLVGTSIISSFLYVLPSYAAFSLDPTFGSGGKVITSFGNYSDAGSVALQSDGKAVVAGSNSNGGHINWAIGRYNTDGSLDTSFGSNGTVTQDFGFDNNARAVIIQSDGKIVVAGSGANENEPRIWTIGRYNSNGSLDTSFGGSGIIANPLGDDLFETLNALVLQPDGKIIAAGYLRKNGAETEYVTMVRYNTDGSYDQAFGIGGIVTYHLDIGTFQIVRSAALQFDGKIDIFGESSGTPFLIQFNTDGSVDTTFGSNGSVSENSLNGIGFAVAIQSDGKIVVTGEYNQSVNRTFVIRYNTDGSHDNSFGSGGFVLNPLATFDSSDNATSLVIQPSDGKVIFGGNALIGSSYEFVLGRLNTDGSLDTNFGTNGAILTPMGTGGSSTIFHLARQTDGKILAVGGASNGSYDDWALARYAAIPSVGTITAPSSPVLVNTAITASANFTDPDSTGTHIASWNWGDGNTTTGTVTESNGSGSVSDNHTYTATGVYTITLTVTNTVGGVGTSTYQYVAVYDSSTSFAGGRSFDNPSSASPNTTGKVTFGISSKYNNSNVLTGSVKMNFKAANLDFASTSLSSLATSTGKAYLKGNGTVNGSGNYTFLVSGIDGSVVGGNDLIRFQIKDSSNTVIYDSQPGAGETTDPTTVDATGNIRVH
jgi:uncharacterized delta-60 repeat protein